LSLTEPIEVILQMIAISFRRRRERKIEALGEDDLKKDIEISKL
jgi:hypothetical protein